MSVINKKYQFRGLDTRANKLYRQEGTASDCRNVFTDSNNNLIKRPDFEALDIPRGAATDRAVNEPSGEFLDKLPPTAEIIDIMEYEDHLVIATRVIFGDITTQYVYKNKFYKYFEDIGVLEFIPFAHETKYDLDVGRVTDSTPANVGGKFTKINQESILYFMGQYPEENVSNPTFGADLEAKENNLSYMFYYDGEMVGKAGVPSVFEDTTTDTQSLVSDPDQYVRLLPFKIDSQNRTTFGNYSTHRAVNNLQGDAQQILVINGDLAIEETVEYQCHARYTGVTAVVAEGDTLPVNIWQKTNIGPESVMVGQYMYNIDKTVTSIGTVYNNNFQVYKFRVTAVDYGTSGNNGDDGTITIDDIQFYDSVAGKFVDAGTMQIQQNSFVSNHMIAIYGSDDLTFGYTLKGLTIYAYNKDQTSQEFRIGYHTPKGGAPNIITEVNYNQPLLSIFDEFEDGYDEDSVKLPPPRGRHVVDYLGALLVVDHQSLYFSDFSVGGTIENFTPFDTFSVGSSKRGEITGVFANETFLSVFREEEAYYVTGNIFLANYRVQSYQSTRIGCTDPKSIIDFKGAGLFLSKRGIYFCQQGGSMPEISDQIETIFTDGELGLNLDLTKCSSLVDFRREYIYFHIASTTEESGYVLAFDYNKNEWYLWDNVNGNNGFEMFDNVMYYSDGDDVYREAATSINSDAYYRSNFETLGEPSFIKKFLQVLLFTIDTTQAATIGIKTRRDWNESEIDTDQSKQVSAGQVDMTQRLNPKRSKSLAIEINSTSGNQLILNGYEYEVEADVRMFKSDD